MKSLWTLAAAALALVAPLSGASAQDAAPEIPAAAAAVPVPAALDADVWPEAALDDDEAGTIGREAMPFTQSQIEALGRLLRQTRAAAARAEGPLPAGRLRRVTIDPGALVAPPPIVLRRGYTTVVSVTDLTGAPWSLDETVVDRGFLVGDPPGDDAGEVGHLVYLGAARDHAHGNVALKLRGLAEPIVLQLVEAAGEVDFRVDLRVPLAGPAADVAALTRPTAFGSGDAVLVDLLHGVTPEGAARLDVAGGGAATAAWRLGDDVLLLTRADILSPAPAAAERGAGQQWAYRLPATPFALVSEAGREARLAFTARETFLEVEPGEKP